MDINKLYCIDNVEGMKQLPDNFIDLTVTSPPYSDLRDYNKFEWDFEELARQLFRTTKIGGTVVWVVGDKTKNGCEELTPFRQAIYFQDVIGFNTWDTMIYSKNNCPFPANVRYNQMFEFMFVFTKGTAKTFNPIFEMKSKKELDKIKSGRINVGTKSFRNKDGSTKRGDSDKRMLKRLENSVKKETKVKGNVWNFNSGYMVGSKDKVSFKHPATFPEQLAHDHIVSWSNEGDLVFDPFVGSGTTAKMAKILKRNYLGFDCSQEYINIAKERLSYYE